MRDPERIARITAKLYKFWLANPDWRLGQIVSNLKGLGPQEVFYYEDDQLEKRLEQALAGTIDWKEQQ